MTVVQNEPAVRFALPEGSEAGEPPERRGTARDGVRLLVARPNGLEHRRFRELPGLLEPGDLLVVNTSATLAAAVDAVDEHGEPVALHVSTALRDREWVVELRRQDGTGPDLRTPRPGVRLSLPDGLRLQLTRPYPDGEAVSSRLWRVRLSRVEQLADYLEAHGSPVRYGYVPHRYPLSDYQTVFGRDRGSAEMASAGRPFTAELVVELVTRGVVVAPVVLHAGVSSPELHEPPLPERFAVPAATARLVGSTRAAGRRVVAVGTTVVRALESAASPDGTVTAASGWTDLVLGPQRPARVVGGLVTGLHAPQASHLLLLEAVAGRALVSAAYRAAVQERYLWHEFGDSSIFLP